MLIEIDQDSEDTKKLQNLFSKMDFDFIDSISGLQNWCIFRSKVLE